MSHAYLRGFLLLYNGTRCTRSEVCEDIPSYVADKRREFRIMRHDSTDGNYYNTKAYTANTARPVYVSKMLWVICGCCTFLEVFSDFILMDNSMPISAWTIIHYTDGDLQLWILVGTLMCINRPNHLWLWFFTKHHWSKYRVPRVHNSTRKYYGRIDF